MAIICIAHSKGGVGKSLLAWHLAIARPGTSIVDLDFQKTMVFANSLRKGAELPPLEIIHVDSDEDFITMMEEWPEDKDLIIDVGGFDASINRMAMLISDIVITPAVDHVQEMAGLSKFHEIVDDISSKIEGADIRPYVLLNNVDPSSKDFSVINEVIESFERYQRMETIIRRRADFYNSIKVGKGVTEFTDGKATEELLQLDAEIRRIIEAQ